MTPIDARLAAADATAAATATPEQQAQAAVWRRQRETQALARLVEAITRPVTQ